MGTLSPILRRHAGEDTALAPLIPRLLSVLEGRGKGHVSFSEIAAVGEAYVTTMRSRYLPASQKSRIVDKMLRNAWNVAYIAMMLPKVEQAVNLCQTLNGLCSDSRQFLYSHIFYHLYEFWNLALADSDLAMLAPPAAPKTKAFFSG